MTFPRDKAGMVRMARRALRGPARFLRRAVLPRVMPAASQTRLTDLADIRVVGLLASASGIGKSARLCAEVLKREGHRVTGSDVSRLFGAADGIAHGIAPPNASVRGGVSIYHLNPPMLLPGILQSGLARYYRSYNIGYWAWELETLPPEWVDALRFVDAVFVPSVFCRDAVRRHCDKPVVVVPHPVDAGALPRTKTPSGRFRVLSIFNYGSSFARKNPVALIEAFRLAFGDDPHAELVLKTSQGHRHGADRMVLDAAAAGMANVTLIDEVWPEERLLQLIADCDVYASLHRSEGFGLTLAEAIMQETPVVATNWSGNSDFCDPNLSYPVDYTLVPFSDGHGDYSEVARARWAEPSIAHAAAQLTRIRRAPEEARQKAALLKVALQQHLAEHTYANALAGLVQPVAQQQPRELARC